MTAKAKWPVVPLGEVLVRSNDWIQIDPTQEYKEVTVKLWGKGVTLRRLVSGSEIAGSRKLRVRMNQFILSRIDARNGAFGLIPAELDGAVVSNDFPVFDCNPKSMSFDYLGWLSKTATFVDACRKASEGTTNRVRLKEDQFYSLPIPLPPLFEQRRIVAKIEQLANKIEEVKKLRHDVVNNNKAMLQATFSQIIDGAKQLPMSEVAPLTRRPVPINIEQQYAELGVRSFGKGTFHKPTLRGSELTWQKLFQIRTGDIVISNIKAWEGAVATAGPSDDKRVGSHRYLTCLPTSGKVTSVFVCFYLLSRQGLAAIGQASPGSADRNRTLGQKSLQSIMVSVPPYDKQLWFDSLYGKVEELINQQTRSTTELNALLPSILDKAFKGELLE